MLKIKILSLILLSITLTCAAIYRDSRLEERMHIKYFNIHESAEPHRKKIEKAYAYWSKRTGIKFIEQYKPFRTVIILASQKSESPKKNTVGLYIITKHIIVYDTDDFYGIVLHEIGHSIGLAHNNNILDTMYPTTDNYDLITITTLNNLKKAMQKKDYLLFF